MCATGQRTERPALASVCTCCTIDRANFEQIGCELGKNANSAGIDGWSRLGDNRDHQRRQWHDGSLAVQTIISGPHTRHRQGRQVDDAGEKHCHWQRSVYICHIGAILLCCQQVRPSLVTERKMSKNAGNNKKLSCRRMVK